MQMLHLDLGPSIFSIILKVGIRCLHKDAKEGPLEVALGLHLWLHLLIKSVIYKFIKKWFI